MESARRAAPERSSVRIEARLRRDVRIGAAHDLCVGMLVLKVEELERLRIYR